MQNLLKQINTVVSETKPDLEQKNLQKEKLNEKIKIDYPECFETIDKCNLISVLGEGATSKVYLASHNFLKKLVAIKIMSPSEINTKELEEKFILEARNSARLEHPNIVKIFDAGIFNHYKYIVMEHIDGYNLSQIINQSGHVNEEKAINILISVSKALEYSLSLNILHRDIKPENILIDKNGNVKVLDFGLSKLLHNVSESDENNISGTLLYMPPEQILQYPEDNRHDMYSLGLSIYYILLGKHPFYSEAVKDVIYKHLKETPPLLCNIANVSKELSLVINKMIEKDPEKRFSSYNQIVDILEKIKKLKV